MIHRLKIAKEFLRLVGFFVYICIVYRCETTNIYGTGIPQWASFILRAVVYGLFGILLVLFYDTLNRFMEDIEEDAIEDTRHRIAQLPHAGVEVMNRKKNYATLLVSFIVMVGFCLCAFHFNWALLDWLLAVYIAAFIDTALCNLFHMSIENKTLRKYHIGRDDDYEDEDDYDD